MPQAMGICCIIFFYIPGDGHILYNTIKYFHKFCIYKNSEKKLPKNRFHALIFRKFSFSFYVYANHLGNFEHLFLHMHNQQEFFNHFSCICKIDRNFQTNSPAYAKPTGTSNSIPLHMQNPITLAKISQPHQSMTRK